MKVGIPKEIKNNENRVGMTPAGVAELVRRGHEVSVQHTAGEGSGFADDDYVKAGAKILPTIEAVYSECDMIVKVKEPIEPEYKLVRPGQLLFTYFHVAGARDGSLTLYPESETRPLIPNCDRGWIDADWIRVTK